VLRQDVDGLIIAAALWDCLARSSGQRGLESGCLFSTNQGLSGAYRLLWAAYQSSDDTWLTAVPRIARSGLELARLVGSGQPATPSLACFRIILVAVSLGMGYAGYFSTREALGWHDRIRNLPMPRNGNLCPPSPKTRLPLGPSAGAIFASIVYLISVQAFIRKNGTPLKAQKPQ